MSDFHVQVVRLADVIKHPNADTLSVGDANGHPVIFRTGDYQEGQLVVHIPIDSVVPDKPEWSFLDGHRRIKAKRLRGVFSMGMIAKAPPDAIIGQNVQELFEIVKYERPVDGGHGGPISGDAEEDPGFLPEYTDLESYRRYKTVLQDGELVTLTEKTHGCSGRYLYRDGRLWVGSHHRILKPPTEPQMKYRGYWRKVDMPKGERHATRPFDTEAEAQAELDATIAATVHYEHMASGHRTTPDAPPGIPLGVEHALYVPKVSSWWQIARDLDLETKLATIPGIGLYGEVFGAVQDLKYGRSGIDLVLFDAMDTRTFRYLDRAEFVAIAAGIDLPTAPVLYEGPWNDSLLTLAEGKSTIPGADCIREGFVVKPNVERRDRLLGRVALKVVGEGYLTRKGA